MRNATATKATFVAGVVLSLMIFSLLWASFPTSHVSAGFTPTPESPSPPPDDDGDDDDDDDDGDGDDPCRQGAILGRVTDLCLGQPAAGVQVEINGNLVRTDGDGRYSLTGLSPGNYSISVQVSSEWEPSQLTASIDQCGQQINVDLNYNSCLAPTPTPGPAPDLILPEAGAEKKFAGWEAWVLIIGGVCLVAGGFLVRRRQ